MATRTAARDARSFQKAHRPDVGTAAWKAPARTARPTSQSGLQLHTAAGARKYLTIDERDAFLRVAEQADRPVRTLCMTLAYSGCRLSEALALTADRIDLALVCVLVFESLKKRRPGVYCNVPVPPALLAPLDLVHGIREIQARRSKGHGIRLWPWSRMTGWRAVHAVMRAAGLEGVPASPEGAAARVRRRRRLGRHPAQPGAEMARPCPALDHSDLRRCGRRRGDGHRPADVGVGLFHRGDARFRRPKRRCDWR